jgi:hypothetical protein
MQNRWHFLAGILLLCPCVAGYQAITFTTGVNAANFGKIAEGMSVAEVEAILGRPADSRRVLGGKNPVTRTQVSCAWRGLDLTIRVGFTGDGRVTFKYADAEESGFWPRLWRLAEGDGRGS